MGSMRSRFQTQIQAFAGKLPDGYLMTSSRLLPSRPATSSSAASPSVTDGASYIGNRCCLSLVDGRPIVAGEKTHTRNRQTGVGRRVLLLHVGSRRGPWTSTSPLQDYLFSSYSSPHASG